MKNISKIFLWAENRGDIAENATYDNDRGGKEQKSEGQVFNLDI